MRLCAFIVLTFGVVALLCMTRPERAPVSSDAVVSHSAAQRIPASAWHRTARPSLEAAVPEEFATWKYLAEQDSAGGIEALEEFLASTTEAAPDGVFLWLANEPEAAARWIESLPDGALRNGIIERLLNEFAHRNPTGAVTLAGAISEPELREAALSSVLRRWASDSPVEALNAIAAEKAWRESPLAGRAFVAAATTFPRQIKELLAILPQESVDNSFLALGTETLLAKDPDAIALWFESVQTADQRSAIAETVMRYAGRNRPELAFNWATQLSDPVQRSDALQNLMDRTAQRDAEAATALFDSPWLSNEDRDGLLIWFARRIATPEF